MLCQRDGAWQLAGDCDDHDQHFDACHSSLGGREEAEQVEELLALLKGVHSLHGTAQDELRHTDQGPHIAPLTDHSDTRDTRGCDAKARDTSDRASAIAALEHMLAQLRVQEAAHAGQQAAGEGDTQQQQQQKALRQQKKPKAAASKVRSGCMHVSTHTACFQARTHPFDLQTIYMHALLSMQDRNGHNVNINPPLQAPQQGKEPQLAAGSSSAVARPARSATAATRKAAAQKAAQGSAAAATRTASEPPHSVCIPHNVHSRHSMAAATRTAPVLPIASGCTKCAQPTHCAQQLQRGRASCRPGSAVTAGHSHREHVLQRRLEEMEAQVRWLAELLL